MTPWIYYSLENNNSPQLIWSPPRISKRKVKRQIYEAFCSDQRLEQGLINMLQVKD